MLDIDDTIVAIASPTTPAIRGIVRLSGPGVLNILQRMGLSVVGEWPATDPLAGRKMMLMEKKLDTGAA